MTDYIYLVVNKNGVARMNKEQKPTIQKGERFFRVDIEVANSFFDVPPIPSVNLKVENPHDLDQPEISVSESQPPPKGLSETWQAQLKINRAAARLFETSFRSGDAETQLEALEILKGLQAEGIKVAIEVPGDLAEAAHV